MCAPDGAAGGRQRREVLEIARPGVGIAWIVRCHVIIVEIDAGMPVKGARIIGAVVEDRVAQNRDARGLHDRDSGQETVCDHVAQSRRGAAEGNNGVVLHADALAVVAQRSDAVRGRAEVVALHGDRAAEDAQAASVARNHVAGRGGGATNRGRTAERDAVAAAQGAPGARRLHSAGNIGADEVALHRQTNCIADDAGDPVIENHVASASGGTTDQERAGTRRNIHEVDPAHAIGQRRRAGGV